jgi:threonine/homoserine/homoserine lactone efflux protein
VVSLWAFLAVAVPLVLMPGASTAIVLRNSLQGGTRAGLETAVGANAGSGCYGILSALGFAVALQRWPQAWTVLRIVGCLYLAWLGLLSLRKAISGRVERPADEAIATRTATRDPARNLQEGFVTNVSNPAIATFYFVVLPQFIVPGAHVLRAALLLTGVHIALALSWHAAWAAAGGALSHALASGGPRRALDLFAGIALLFLAVTLAVQVRTSGRLEPPASDSTTANPRINIHTS